MMGSMVGDMRGVRGCVSGRACRRPETVASGEREIGRALAAVAAGLEFVGHLLVIGQSG